MNIENQKFEEWRKEQIASLIRTGHLEAAKAFENLGSIHWMAWQCAWQASRESLVIELPDDGIEDCQKEWPERGAKYEYDTFDTGYLYACMKHEQAIHAAGVKTKLAHEDRLTISEVQRFTR